MRFPIVNLDLINQYKAQNYQLLADYFGVAERLFGFDGSEFPTHTITGVLLQSGATVSGYLHFQVEEAYNPNPPPETIPYLWVSENAEWPEGFISVSTANITCGSYWGGPDPGYYVIRTYRATDGTTSNRLGLKIDQVGGAGIDFVASRQTGVYIPAGYDISSVRFTGTQDGYVSLSIRPLFTTKLVNVKGVDTFAFLGQNGEVLDFRRPGPDSGNLIVDRDQTGWDGYKCGYIDLGQHNLPTTAAANSHLCLTYDDFGILQLNGYLPYLKDRRHNYSGWETIPGTTLEVAYDVQVTSTIYASIKSNNVNGLIDFSGDENTSSLFYHNYVTPSNSLAKKVYIQPDVPVPIQAADGNGATFKAWIDDTTLEPVSTERTVSVPPNGESVERTAIFTQSGNGSKTVAVLAAGGGVSEIVHNGVSTGVSAYSFDDGAITIKNTNAASDTHTYFTGLYDSDGFITKSAEYAVDTESITTKIFRAVFRDANAYTLILDTVEGGSVVVTESAGVDSSGRYYEGPMTFVASPANTKQFVGYRLNNGSDIIDESDYTFSFDFCVDNAIDGVIRITPVFIDAAYGINVSIDENSRHCGGEIEVEYDDVIHTGQDISVDITDGDAFTVRITPNPDSVSGNAISRVLLVSEDTTDVTSRFVMSGGVYSGIFNAGMRFSLVVYFGTMASVVARTVTQTPATGTVGISLSSAGPWGQSVQYEYGNPVYVRAVNGTDPDSQYNVFWSWHTSDDTAFVRPIQGAEAIAEMHPSGTVTYVALFGGVNRNSFICLTNNGNRYGTLRLTEIIPNTVTQYETFEDFCEAIDATNPHIIPVNPSSAGAGRTGNNGGAASLYAADSGDKWYKIANGANVLISVEVAPDEPWSFLKFTHAPYAKLTYTAGGDDYVLHVDSSTKADVSTASSFSMSAIGAGVVTCVYESTTPRMIYAKYNEGSSSACGILSISPWPPEDPWEADSGKGGKYKPNTDIELHAIAKTGYRFTGWYLNGVLVSTSPNYKIQITSSSESTISYFASFATDSFGVYEWEGNADKNLRMDWRSKRFTNPQPVDFAVASVCADGYPNENDRAANLTVHHASSPNAGDGDWRDAEISVYDQDPRRLPMCRPERYVEVEVKSSEPVLRLAVSTSMGNLISQ